MNTNVTRDDIEDFRSNATVARDWEMAAICGIALGDNCEDLPRRDVCDYATVAKHTRMEIGCMCQEDAWDEASAMILEARAMNDSPPHSSPVR